VLIVGVILLALAVVALAAWPFTLLGGCFAVGAWALRTRRAAPMLPVGVNAVGPDVPRLAETLPPSAHDRVDRIIRKARALAGSAASPRDQHLVQRTLDDYLPRAVDAYQSLPPGSAEWPVSPDGRTGLRLLEDQLDLLERNLDDIAGHAWRRGTQRLLAHERFLEERLGTKSSEDLDIPR
jgi:hypothetical protein